MVGDRGEMVRGSDGVAGGLRRHCDFYGIWDSLTNYGQEGVGKGLRGCGSCGRALERVGGAPATDRQTKNPYAMIP